MVDTFAMRELLKGEYKTAFDKISLYGDMSNLNKDIMDDKIYNIYDLLMEAQNEGKPVEKIVGTNLEKFCKNYFKYEGIGSVVKEVCKRMFYLANIGILNAVLDYFLFTEEKVSISDASVELRPFVIAFIVVFFMMSYGKYVRKKKLFVDGEVKLTGHYVVCSGIFFVGIGGLTVLLRGFNIKVLMLPVVLICGVYIFCYILFTMISRMTKYGSLKNPYKLSREEKVEKKASDKEIKEKSENISTARDLSERYARLKRKNEKKGKPEYTMEEFIKLIKKEVSQEKGLKIFMIALAIFSTVTTTVQSYESDGIKGAIVAIVILGGIMTAITVFMWKVLTEVYVSMKQVIETCEMNGVSIEEYARELSE